MRRYSPEEIALFIGSSADLSDLPESEIATALARWTAHMEAGGYEVGFDLEDLDAGERRHAFMLQQEIEHNAWLMVVAELRRYGVGEIEADGEHESLHDHIALWGEELAQLRLRDPDPSHAERALEERRLNWLRWEGDSPV